MKNSILNIILGVIWIVSAILNVVNKAGWVIIGYNVIVAIFFLVLGISQYVFGKQGPEGLAKVRKITIASLIFLFVGAAFITIIGLL